MKKKLTFFITIVTILLFSINKVNAASGTITISSNKSQVVVGNSVTFTVKVSYSSGMSALQYEASYDSSMLSLTSGNLADVVGLDNVKSKTYTYTFKAKKAGTATFKFSAVGAPWSGDSEISFTTKSKSVKIITQEELESSYSSNNKLASLEVEGATISPKFSSSITSYTVNLPANTESIKISGKKDDSTASVSGFGEHEVEDGTNTIKIVVTAQNGSTKTYTINAIVEELDPIEVTVGENKLTVVRKEKLLEAPNSEFKATTTTIDDKEIPALVNENANLLLIGLKDETGNISLFVYNEKEHTYKPYNQYTFKETVLYIVEKEVPNFDKKTSIKIEEKDTTVYNLKDDEFYYFYAINLETGKENLYSYDKEEQTIQRCLTTKEGEVIMSNQEDVKLYKYIILGLLAFIFITYFVILLVLIFKKNKEIDNEEEEQDDNEQQIEDDTTKENNKMVKHEEKEKFIKEQSEEIKRINIENSSDNTDVTDSINELVENKKKKNKNKNKKKKENENDIATKIDTN